MGVLSRLRRPTMPALVRADQLAGRGRWLEAIELLRSENRKHPDPATAAQLVQFRNRAFVELDRNGGPASLPQVGDAFPGVRGVPPEIAANDLDAATIRAAIQHHGSLVVRGLLPEADVEHLRDDIDRAFAAREAGETGAPADRWYEPLVAHDADPDILAFDRAIAIVQASLLAADSPPAFFDVVEAYRRLGIGELLADYFGEPPILSARKTTLRRMGSDQFFDVLEGRGVDSGWHQDGAFLGEGVRTVNMWVSLSHCGQDAPSIDLIARRIDRILPTGTEGAPFDWAASPAVVEEAADGALVHLEFAPGDALFFDGLCVHQTGARRAMTRQRYAIESWFFAPSTYPLEWIPLVF